MMEGTRPITKMASSGYMDSAEVMREKTMMEGARRITTTASIAKIKKVTSDKFDIALSH